MEIEILNTHKNDFSPVIGERTMELLSRFGQKLDEDGIDTLSSETIEILSHCTNPYKNEVQSVTNLVVGYVQSGKTMSFTTLSALAHDNGFRIIIYFAGTKNNLLSQTTKRLRKDLINGSANSAYYKLFENPTLEYAQRIRNALNISSKPTILITVLKHHKYISDLAAMFNSMQLKQTLGKAGVLIIDDEADQASLNGYAYKNSKSEEWEDDEYTTTYSSIMKLKGALANHSYIQYTATPQGPLLISIMDLLSPKHHTVLTPGKTYTGGKTFFCDEPGLIITIPEGEVFHSKHNNLADCPDSLVNALQLHLMGVAIIVKLLQKESFLSMMIHADRDQDASEKFYRWIKNIIDAWSNILANGEQDLGYQELKDSFAKCYPESIRMYEAHNESAPSFEDIWCCIDDIILDTNVELVISRNKRQGENKEIDWASSCSHILVGADMLNRGFTVEHLAVTYMPRCSVGKSTADTIQQRCRFFGYKQNYLWSCRVFLPFEVIIEYKEYVEHEEEMRKWLLDNKNLEDVERLLLISNRLNATRKNILSKHTVTTKLNGWRKMNAFQAIDENTTFVNRFLADVELKLFENYGTDDRNHGYVKLPIQRITWQEAMDRFGSDKPDMRFGMELHDVSEVVKDCGFVVFKNALEAGGSVRGINAEGQGSMPRKKIDKLVDFAKTYGAKGLAYIAIAEDGTRKSSFAKFMTEEEMDALVRAMEGKPGDLLLFAADKNKVVYDVLGALRVELAKQMDLLDKNEYRFVWVTEFPLLEWSEEENRYTAMHHPFTMLMEEDIPLIESGDLGKIRAKAYDIVLNGNEIGGGSVRIHQNDIQEKMFEMLGFTKDAAYKQFGFLLNAFKYGVPPHAGLAYGLDRLVMLMAKVDSIRDVIAFPKVKDASCLMTESPSVVSEQQLEELGLETAKEETTEE